jgi:hypothetical protein
MTSGVRSIHDVEEVGGPLGMSKVRGAAFGCNETGALSLKRQK